MVSTAPLSPSAAVIALRAAKVIAVPTETVYGLAANAFDTVAVAQIYALKQRPANNPLIVHVRDVAQAKTLAHWSRLAETLATAFWPGALTLVLPRRLDAPVAPAVLAGQETIALRCPAHPVMQGLLAELDFPLAAPSANPSGRISPTTPAHVRTYWPALPILEGGACTAGLESTIVALADDAWQVLRPGTITEAEIAAVIGTPPSPLSYTPTVPGQAARHYAPTQPLRLNAVMVQPTEGLLAFGVPLTGAMVTYNLSPAGDVAEAAHNLYAMLHSLDNANVTGIAVMPIPETGVGAALNNRLARAAAGALHLHDEQQNHTL